MFNVDINRPVCTPIIVCMRTYDSSAGVENRYHSQNDPQTKNYM